MPLNHAARFLCVFGGSACQPVSLPATQPVRLRMSHNMRCPIRTRVQACMHGLDREACEVPNRGVAGSSGGHAHHSSRAVSRGCTARGAGAIAVRRRSFSRPAPPTGGNAHSRLVLQRVHRWNCIMDGTAFAVSALIFFWILHVDAFEQIACTCHRAVSACSAGAHNAYTYGSMLTSTEVSSGKHRHVYRYMS